MARTLPTFLLIMVIVLTVVELCVLLSLVQGHISSQARESADIRLTTRLGESVYIRLLHVLNSKMIRFRLEWFKSPPTKELVSLYIHNTAHYAFDGDGVRQWAKLMPDGGHTIHLHDDEAASPLPSTPTLFHQLKCLELYHQEYMIAPPIPPSNMVHHCLNYLRQQILCHLNMKLELVHNEMAQSVREYATVCRDWTVVYAEAARNFEGYHTWINETKVIQGSNRSL